ncbi:MAG: hypothetical protein IH583_16495 [Candidatus Aminicenantes bacterium]|jgi:hypothetical protein|nr:hypothetical protein [Candidatus Aminicenantes bacterium]
MRSRGLTIGILVLGSLAALAFAATAVDVNGVWELTMQTPQGDMTADATFVQDKEAFKFTMPGPQGMEMNGEGTVKDKDLEWTVTVSTQMGEFVLVFKGKVEGETMSGEVQMGDFGTAPWTAKKKK